MPAITATKPRMSQHKSIALRYSFAENCSKPQYNLFSISKKLKLCTMLIFTKVLDRAFADYLVGFLSDLY